jgi:hypothetical protein
MSRLEEQEQTEVDRRLLLSLHHIQERNMLVNQALLRQRLAQEEHIKAEEEEEEEEEEEREEEGERNNNWKGGVYLSGGRGTWDHAPSSQKGGSSRLAFSVENILAPGRFSRGAEEDDDNLGES